MKSEIIVSWSKEDEKFIVVADGNRISEGDGPLEVMLAAYDYCGGVLC